jgi:hypothetical protein
MPKIFTASMLSVSLSILLVPSAHAFGGKTLFNKADIADTTDFSDSSPFLSSLIKTQDSLSPVSAQTQSVAGSAVKTAVNFQAQSIASLSPQVATSSLNEGFNDISTLAGAGWAFQNNSSPAPITPTATANWSQGDPIAILTAQSGPQNSYIYANSDSTGGNTGQINNWLITPELDFSQGGIFSFFTRTVAGQGASFSTYLEVRQSLSGISTNVGSSSSDVGDFSILNTTVGSLDSSVAYPGNFLPNTFGRVTFNIAPTAGTGRLAFRYFAPDGGLSGTQGGLVAIDTVTFDVPEPALASGFSGFAVLGFVNYFKRRRTLKSAG